MHDCTAINGAGCTRYIDPANPGWTTGLPTTSAQTLGQVYVPEHHKYPTYDNDFQAPLPASQLGTNEYRTYASPTSTAPVGEHSVSVYLPKGYDPNRTEPYKTLYLSHGGGGNDSDWFTQGVAQYILENAVREGDVQPMVLVATNYNGFGAGNTAPAVNGFLADLKTNAIPFVEDNYNVSSDPANRAIVALSAGSARTLPLLYTDPGYFEYYGFWTAGGNWPFPTAEQLANSATVEGTLHIGVGIQDFQSNINNLSFQRAYAIRVSGAEVVEHNINGIHSWDVWRQLLDDFLHNIAFKKTEVSVSAPTDVAANRSAKVTVQVTSLSDAAEAPRGKVKFYLGSTEGEYLGAAELGKDGKASLPFKVKSSGDVSVVAEYQGDDYFRSATATTDTIAIH